MFYHYKKVVRLFETNTPKYLMGIMSTTLASLQRVNGTDISQLIDPKGTDSNLGSILGYPDIFLDIG